MDVVLVSMPFAEVQRPSIALGLLRAALPSPEIQSEIVYANFGLAETIGLVAYQAMQATPTDHLLGEWCFAGMLFPNSASHDEEYLDMVLDVRCHGFPAELPERKERMRWVREHCVAYIEHLAHAIVARRPRIVGCSSVFQQHCASLALLKRIRELSPDTSLLMGGANCEGEMGIETLSSFPWVDCIVSGEADAIFADLCRLLLEHGRDVDTSALPVGAVSQRRSALSRAPRPLIREMDALPTPDYDHYFETLRGSTLQNMIQPGLLAESSRGCWWGEKAHCTFCGLNGEGMTYRSKSPERVLGELSELAGRYGVRGIQFVDNILDMSFFRTVLPQLAAEGGPYSLFYETKANLKREHVELLAKAGVKWIQPGIESLDDNLLALIAKGNSTLMNVQLLKWTREFGIDAAWNMLCGIPGESDAWYDDMATWLPTIFHLQPPTGVSRVRYDRFSPYHMRPQQYGLRLEPSRAYRYVYPLPQESLMRLAYSFEDGGRPRHVHRGLTEEPGQQRLQQVVREWNELWHASPPVLQAHEDGDRVHFVDSRACAAHATWTAGGLDAAVYRLCDSAQTSAALAQHISAKEARDVSVPDVESAIQHLLERRVVLSAKGRVLSLGVRAV